MNLFGKGGATAYELLGKSREKILSQRPAIPAPGKLARPAGRPEPAAGTAVADAPRPRFSGGPVAASVLERAVDDLLDVDGDPLLVIDDELDVSAITPEDQVIDEPPAQILGVRADTAVVFGIGLVLVVAIAYLAGRTTKAPVPEASPAPPKVAVAGKTAPPGAPLVAPNALDLPAQDETPPAAPEKPAKPAVEAKDRDKVAEPVRAPADGGWEIKVVATSDAKAARVVEFLNSSRLSPLDGKPAFQAYAKKFPKCAEVRIRGFESDKDQDLLASVRDMSDPTGGGGFHDARYAKISK